MDHRYAMRREENDLWVVYDIDNAAPVVIGDVPMIGLHDYEALEVLEMLKAGLVLPSRFPRPTSVGP